MTKKNRNICVIKENLPKINGFVTCKETPISAMAHIDIPTEFIDEHEIDIQSFAEWLSRTKKVKIRYLACVEESSEE